MRIIVREFRMNIRSTPAVTRENKIHSELGEKERYAKREAKIDL